MDSPHFTWSFTCIWHDMVDHRILIDRLEQCLGLSGTFLTWFKSYHTNWFQRVSVGGVTSGNRPLSCGILQGSVLGPITFTMYTLPLNDIVHKYGLCFHIYTDDTQLYLSFNSHDPSSETLARHCIDECIREIWSWMSSNKRKLNDSKTEVIYLSNSSSKQSTSTTPVMIGSDKIHPNDCAKNLGVVLDSNLSLSPHAVCKAFHFQLFHLSRIWKYLTPKPLKLSFTVSFHRKLTIVTASSTVSPTPYSTSIKLLKIVLPISSPEPISMIISPWC